MTRRYVESLLLHDERELFLGGIWAITGFTQQPVTVIKGSRAGTSYTLRRRIALFVNAITSFSSKPLVLVFYLGTMISTAAACAAVVLIIRKILFGADDRLGFADRVHLASWRHHDLLSRHHRSLSGQGLHRDQAEAVFDRARGARAHIRRLSGHLDDEREFEKRIVVQQCHAARDGPRAVVEQVAWI